MTGPVGVVTMMANLGFNLNEPELAKIGMLAVIEARANFLMSAVLKSVSQSSVETFIKSERWQLKQIVEKIVSAAADLDAELLRLVNVFEQCRRESHDLRHRYVHAVWGLGEAGQSVARDASRKLNLSPEDLDAAVVEVERLNFHAHQCATRTAELIAIGQLPGGADERPKVKIFHDEKWIQF